MQAILLHFATITFKKAHTIKVAIYGGSFDPPHIGHIATIEEALKSLDIDKLFLIPTYLNPFKSEVFAEPDIRLQWMEKIAVHYEKVEALNIESSLQESQPTYKTLEALKLRYTFTAKPYVIIGADNVEHLHKWYHYDRLKNEVIFVVAKRKNFETEHPYMSLDVDCDISSTTLRHNPNKAFLPAYIADEILAYYKEHNERKN